MASQSENGSQPTSGATGDGPFSSFPSFSSFDHHRSPDGHAAAIGESVVGVYESQRYLTLESTRLTFPNSPILTDQFTKLLGEACDELLEACGTGLGSAQDWLAGVRNASWGSREKVEARRKERLRCMETVKSDLDAVIERFRKHRRYWFYHRELQHNSSCSFPLRSRQRVLDPYRCAFQPKHVCGGVEGIFEAPPHKYLFHCYVYEYHTLQLAVLLCGIVSPSRIGYYSSD